MSSSSTWRSEKSSWRAGARTSAGPRTAAWEKKWKDLEADLQDAVDVVLKLPENLPAMPTMLGQTEVPVQERDGEDVALQSLSRFVATDLPLRSRYTPRDLPHAEPETVGANQESIKSESTSSVQSKTSDSDTDSTTSVDERRSQPPPQSGQANEEIDAETVLENVEVNVKNYWEDESHGERSNLTTSRLSHLTSSDAARRAPNFQGQIDPLTGNECSSKAGGAGTPTLRHQLSKSNEQMQQDRWKGLRFVRHLWIALVAASFVEFCLISSGLLVDYFWSPCRTELDTCRHLHELDCWGRSCQEFAPLWASAWPAAGLLFLALPLKFFLRTDKRRCTQAVPAVVPVLTSFAVCLLGVVGVGAIVLVESATAALHYSDRCPMRRTPNRCTAELCPSPPCRRESDFSPCLCGPLGEAELARALFLQGTPACQPYEWYTWQMKLLEELMLQYEAFACVLGPLTCVATAVGGALLLIQLACCPLVLIGQWGGHAAICVLLGYLDFEDMPFPSGGISPLHKSAFKSASSMSILSFGKETSRDGAVASDKDDIFGSPGNFKHRRTWDGDVSPECR